MAKDKDYIKELFTNSSSIDEEEMVKTLKLSVVVH